jgi:hypothetical protein
MLHRPRYPYRKAELLKRGTVVSPRRGARPPHAAAYDSQAVYVAVKEAVNTPGQQRYDFRAG